MKISIFQIDNEKDLSNLMFMNLDYLKRIQGTPEVNVNSAIYKRVYTGEVDCRDLEEVYTKFNLEHPSEFKGHSLSVSDVVEVIDASGCPELVGRIRFYNSSTAFEEISFTDEKYFQREIREAQEVGRTIQVDYLKDKNVPSVTPGFYFCDSVGFKKVPFTDMRQKCLDEVIDDCVKLKSTPASSPKQEFPAPEK